MSSVSSIELQEWEVRLRVRIAAQKKGLADKLFSYVLMGKHLIARIRITKEEKLDVQSPDEALE